MFPAIVEYFQVTKTLNISKLHLETMKNVKTVHFMPILIILWLGSVYIYSKNNETSFKKHGKKSNFVKESPHLLEVSFILL